MHNEYMGIYPFHLFPTGPWAPREQGPCLFTTVSPQSLAVCLAHSRHSNHWCQRAWRGPRWVEREAVSLVRAKGATLPLGDVQEGQVGSGSCILPSRSPKSSPPPLLTPTVTIPQFHKTSTSCVLALRCSSDSGPSSYSCGIRLVSSETDIRKRMCGARVRRAVLPPQPLGPASGANLPSQALPLLFRGVFLPSLYHCCMCHHHWPREACVGKRRK